MEHKTIVAVIITYNRIEKLRKCIRSVQNQRNAKCDILIVDNGSTVGTCEMVKREFQSPEISYMNLGRNTGCAGGMNAGYREAVLRGYDYIWAMDDDFYPDEDALYEMLKADKTLDHQWGCLSGVAYYPDGSICKANRHKKGIFTFVKDEEYRQEAPIPILMASLASMFVKADVIKEVGLPIKEYFIYSEDYEFCKRISRKYPLYAVPRSTGIHDMAVNMKVNIVSDSQDRQYRYAMLYRNDVNCYRKMGVKGYLYLFTKFAYTLCNILVNEKRDKMGKSKVLIKGFKNGVSFHPSIEYVWQESLHDH